MNTQVIQAPAYTNTVLDRKIVAEKVEEEKDKDERDSLWKRKASRKLGGPPIGRVEPVV